MFVQTAMFVIRLILLAVIWFLYPVSPKEPYKLMLVLPWSEPDPIGPYIGGAFPVALDDIYSRAEFASLTTRYNITWSALDSGCPLCNTLNVTMTNMLAEDYTINVTQKAIFGLAFDCEYVALVASAFDAPYVSPICFDTRMENSAVFKTFSRTIGSGSYWAASLVEIIRKFGWQKITVVISDDETLMGTLNSLHMQMSLIGIRVSEIHVTRDNAQRKLLAYGRNSRVFVLLVRDMKTTVDILSTVDKMKFLGVKDYTFIMVQFRYGSRYLAKYPELMARANGLLVLNVQYPLDDSAWQSFQQRVVRAFTTDQHFDKLDKITDYTAIIPLASYLYDAVMMWATAMKIVLGSPEGSDFQTTSGTRLTMLMKNIEFQGIGRIRKTDSSGNINDNFSLNVIQNQRLVPIATFIAEFGKVSADFQALDSMKGIVWAGNTTEWPSGKPPCGWDDPYCVQRDRRWLIGILSSVFLATLIIIVLGSVFLRRFLKSPRTSDISVWFVDWKNIRLLGTPQRSSAALGRRPANLFGLRYVKETGQTEMVESDAKSSLESIGNSAPSFFERRLFTLVGLLDNRKVAVKRVPPKKFEHEDDDLTKDLEQMRLLRHGNLNEFVGLCVNPENMCILMIYAGKGSLMDVLRDETVNLSWDFKFPLACDIAQGMAYLHKSQLGSHGHLTSRNCVVDSRWACKITDYGMGHFREPPLRKTYTNDTCNDLLWTAPELLRENSSDREMYGSRPGDVYSFGIIMQEITLRMKPFQARVRPDLRPEDILGRVTNRQYPPFRPQVGESQCKRSWRDLMEKCWNEEPSERPEFSDVLSELQNISGNKSDNVVDNMLIMLEKYAVNLEELIEKKTKQLDNETKRVETILNNIFPKSVVTQLMLGNRVTPETFEMVTIYFSDIFEFGGLCTRSKPMQIINLLNAVYSLFDKVIDAYDVYKVETINDSYLVASGLPIRNVIHATEIATMALDILNEVKTFQIPHLPNEQLSLRIGINSGTVVAGVLGLQQPRYCIFGDTVNTASRMESSGLPLQIHTTTSTVLLLSGNEKFKVVERGEMYVKGKGNMITFWLTAGENVSYPKREPQT